MPSARTSLPDKSPQMKKRLLLTLLTGLTAATATPADILRIDENSLQGKIVPAENAPKRGMSKATVEKKFGPPIERSKTVGKPPISSWVYPGYRVYFEYDHVIHTVSQ